MKLNTHVRGMQDMHHFEVFLKVKNRSEIWTSERETEKACY